MANQIGTEQPAIGEVPDGNSAEVAVQVAARRFLNKFPAADLDAIKNHLALSRAFVTINHGINRHLLPEQWEYTRAHHNLLAIIFVSEPNAMSLREIAKEMGVSPPYVTKLVDDFESEGLVERTFSQADRRVTYARLTPEGMERCAGIVTGFVKFMSDVGKVLSKEEKVELTRLLCKYSSGIALLEGT